MVRWAKRRGIQITAEVTPHHLMLTEELVRGYDPTFKVNPPLRTKEDTIALREAVMDGTIDALGTDHAPHSIEKKDCEWEAAAFGMVALEHAASVLQEVVISGGGDWQRFSSLISTKPAEIARLEGQGNLVVGAPANIALIDPTAKRTIEAKTHSKSANNPFAGIELPGQIVHTIFRGKFTVQDGVLA